MSDTTGQSTTADRPEAGTAIVVGAGAGFGRATAAALDEIGWRVVALARSREAVESLRDDSNGQIIPVVGDGRDDELAAKLLAEHHPTAVLVGGGAPPHMAPLHDQTWETLSLHWEADVAIAFTWLQAVLRQAASSLQRVVVLSSGAALQGSPGSGGYAGAKATVRFLTTASAVQSAEMLGLPTTFTAVLPQLTHDTAIGRAAVAGYASMAGQEPDDALDGPLPYDTTFAGQQLALLLSADTADHGSFVLNAEGLSPVPS